MRAFADAGSSHSEGSEARRSRSAGRRTQRRPRRPAPRRTAAVSASTRRRRATRVTPSGSSSEARAETSGSAVARRPDRWRRAVQVSLLAPMKKREEQAARGGGALLRRAHGAAGGPAPRARRDGSSRPRTPSSPTRAVATRDKLTAARIASSIAAARRRRDERGASGPSARVTAVSIGRARRWFCRPPDNEVVRRGVAASEAAAAAPQIRSRGPPPPPPPARAARRRSARADRRPPAAVPRSGVPSRPPSVGAARPPPPRPRRKSANGTLRRRRASPPTPPRRRAHPRVPSSASRAPASSGDPASASASASVTITPDALREACGGADPRVALACDLRNRRLASVPAPIGVSSTRRDVASRFAPIRRARPRPHAPPPRAERLGQPRALARGRGVAKCLCMMTNGLASGRVDFGTDAIDAPARRSVEPSGSPPRASRRAPDAAHALGRVAPVSGVILRSSPRRRSRRCITSIALACARRRFIHHHPQSAHRRSWALRPDADALAHLASAEEPRRSRSGTRPHRDRSRRSRRFPKISSIRSARCRRHSPESPAATSDGFRRFRRRRSRPRSTAPGVQNDHHRAARGPSRAFPPSSSTTSSTARPCARVTFPRALDLSECDVVASTSNVSSSDDVDASSSSFARARVDGETRATSRETARDARRETRASVDARRPCDARDDGGRQRHTLTPCRRAGPRGASSRARNVARDVDAASTSARGASGRARGPTRDPRGVRVPLGVAPGCLLRAGGPGERMSIIPGRRGGGGPGSRRRRARGETTHPGRRREEKKREETRRERGTFLDRDSGDDRGPEPEPETACFDVAVKFLDLRDREGIVQVVFDPRVRRRETAARRPRQKVRAAASAAAPRLDRLSPIRDRRRRDRDLGKGSVILNAGADAAVRLDDRDSGDRGEDVRLRHLRRSAPAGDAVQSRAALEDRGRGAPGDGERVQVSSTSRPRC